MEFGHGFDPFLEALFLSGPPAQLSSDAFVIVVQDFRVGRLFKGKRSSYFRLGIKMCYII